MFHRHLTVVVIVKTIKKPYTHQKLSYGLPFYELYILICTIQLRMNHSYSRHNVWMLCEISSKLNIYARGSSFGKSHRTKHWRWRCDTTNGRCKENRRVKECERKQNATIKSRKWQNSEESAPPNVCPWSECGYVYVYVCVDHIESV